MSLADAISRTPVLFKFNYLLNEIQLFQFETIIMDNIKEQ